MARELQEQINLLSKKESRPKNERTQDEDPEEENVQDEEAQMNNFVRVDSRHEVEITKVCNRGLLN